MLFSPNFPPQSSKLIAYYYYQFYPKAGELLRLGMSIISFQIKATLLA